MTNNIEELLQLTKENNYMLKQIIVYINYINCNIDYVNNVIKLNNNTTRWIDSRDSRFIICLNKIIKKNEKRHLIL